MLKTAVLRTLATERSWRSGFERECGGMAWDEVFFAVEVRCPEAVNHVWRLELKLHGAADGHMDFVGRGHHPRRRRILVLDFPPPLSSGDFDLQSARLGLFLQRMPSCKFRKQKHEQNYDRHTHRAAYDCLGPALSRRMWQLRSKGQ